LLAGSVQVTVASGVEPKAVPPTAVAVPMVGAPGTFAGVAAADGAESGLLPTPLVANTVNVYEVPLVRPATVQLSVLVLQVKPPGVEVTV
jgi:hypothetical protein